MKEKSSVSIWYFSPFGPNHTHYRIFHKPNVSTSLCPYLSGPQMQATECLLLKEGLTVRNDIFRFGLESAVLVVVALGWACEVGSKILPRGKVEGWGRGEIKWEIGLGIYTLLYIYEVKWRYSVVFICLCSPWTASWASSIMGSPGRYWVVALPSQEVFHNPGLNTCLPML